VPHAAGGDRLLIPARRGRVTARCRDPEGVDVGIRAFPDFTVAMHAVGGNGLAERFRHVRAATESLAAPLGPEDQTVQSMPDVSPTKWHRAHTTWFFEAFILTLHDPDYVVHHPDYAFLFNSCYEAIGARYPRPSRGLITRPGIGEVADYRRHVDAAVEKLLADGPDPEVCGLVELGLHHEQQHQELLLMDALHVLAQNPLRPAYQPACPFAAGGVRPDAAGWLDVDGGKVEIGAGGDGFAFDNEGPRHTTWLEPFRLADALVTNGDWLAFQADGGYERAELWLSDGWATVQADGWRAPLYWTEHDGDWSEFTLAGEAPLDLTAPVVHVSHYEADAYARWAGARLPTEAEWEHVVTQPCGTALRDVFGAVWQWTSSPYTPYPRYHAPEGAVGEYNAKFMSNQMVLRGSCTATPPGHERPTYRNFFPPAARWAFSGVRLAADS